jgi:hypothetical protein
MQIQHISLASINRLNLSMSLYVGKRPLNFSIFFEKIKYFALFSYKKIEKF